MRQCDSYFKPSRMIAGGKSFVLKGGRLNACASHRETASEIAQHVLLMLLVGPMATTAISTMHASGSRSLQNKSTTAQTTNLEQ